MPELEKCQSDPRRLKSMFEQRRVRFKTVYGKFCLNNPKSEYIINNHEKYFTVSYIHKSVGSLFNVLFDRELLLGTFSERRYLIDVSI